MIKLSEYSSNIRSHLWKIFHGELARSFQVCHSCPTGMFEHITANHHVGTYPGDLEGGFAWNLPVRRGKILLVPRQHDHRIIIVFLHVHWQKRWSCYVGTASILQSYRESIKIIHTITLLNSLPNKKCETFLGHFHMYVWLKVSSIIWLQKSENSVCLGEHWPLL